MNDRLLNTREVARRLDISEAALSQLRYMKRGPDYIKVNGRNVRYRELAVEAWLDERTVRGERA